MRDEANGGIALIRIYASPDGETHFEDVTVETSPVAVAPETRGAMASPIPVGEARRFGPGSVFLAEDTTGKGHLTWAVGTGELRRRVRGLPVSGARQTPAAPKAGAAGS